MTHDILSIDQAALRLGLQARTVRGYVRDGRLKAVKIGKQYRIARADLDAFAGIAPGPAPGGAEVSSIVEVEDLTPDEGMSLANAVVAAANGRSGRGAPLRAQTFYDPIRRRMKLILVGDLSATAGLLELIRTWLEAHR